MFRSDKFNPAFRARLVSASCVYCVVIPLCCNQQTFAVARRLRQSKRTKSSRRSPRSSNGDPVCLRFTLEENITEEAGRGGKGEGGWR